MTNPLKMTLLSSMLMALLLPAVAQTSAATQNGAVPAQTTTPTQATTPAQSAPVTVQQRKEHQQDRIANGVSSGQLTAGEASNLEKKESELNQEERDMKAMDNGHLNSADRSVLNQQQNQLSNQIYKDKHNAAVQNTDPKSKIGQRAENQQDRIGQGIRSGQLTAGEASNLEKKESELNQEERDMKAMDNGHLNSADRSVLNQQQNQLSNQIYKDKHNAAVQNTDPKSKIGQRAENQQDRIGQGIRSGQLTAGESANLEKQESAVNKETAAERQLNGGKLTQQEKAQVNRQQNHISKEINQDKHNAKRQAH
jgi:hypothetical protein